MSSGQTASMSTGTFDGAVIKGVIEKMFCAFALLRRSFGGCTNTQTVT